MSTRMASPAQELLPMMPQRQGETLELVLYWRAVAKRKWWIIGLGLICGAIGMVATSFMTPIYRATAMLMIEQNKAKLLSIDEVYSGVSANREHYQTQAEMLKSPVLAAAVITKLGLAAHPEFDPRQRKSSFIDDLLPGASGDRHTRDLTPEKLEGAIVTEFLRRVTVSPVRASQLVMLSFDSSDPVLAAQVANAIAEAYLEADIELRSRLTERATDWLAERLSVLKQNLEASERALQQYREREGMLDTKGLAQSGTSRQFEGLLRALSDAKQRRVEAENNQAQIKGTKDPTALPLVLRDGVVDSLKRIEGNAEKRLASLGTRYGSDHVRFSSAEKELNQARENTRKAVQRVLASFTKELEVAQANERAVERALQAVRGSVQDINRKEFQLTALESDIRTHREIYEKFMHRYKETSAAGDAQSGSVARIIDPAIPPGWAYKPNKERIVLIVFMFGILAGAMIVLLIDRIDNTIKSGDEIEEKLALPTLALLPLLEGGKSVGRHYLEQPQSVFSEAVRTARTSIVLAAIDEPSKVLLVTSSVPSEGKTCFAVSLALAHAQTKKAILIEADLRRPSIVQQLGLDASKPGLTDAYLGTATLAECLQRVPGSSLYVLPSGPTPANPLELLSSERFREMMNRIASACEIVIIDSAPLHLVSDAVVLSTMATGVVFVVKAESTPYPLARRCVHTLREAGATIIGVALNQLDFTKAGTYYGTYTDYAQKYGGYETKPAQAS